MIGATIELTCAGCRAWQVQPVSVVLVIERDGFLLPMFPCVKCGSGWLLVSDRSARALLLASGAAVRRAGETGWPPTTLLARPPDRPAAYPRPAPLARLAQRLGRRSNKPPEGDQ